MLRTVVFIGAGQAELLVMSDWLSGLLVDR
jgi:hypothetical protein